MMEDGELLVGEKIKDAEGIKEKRSPVF